MPTVPYLTPGMYRSGHSRATTTLTCSNPPVLVQSQISKDDGTFHLEWNSGTGHSLTANGKLDPRIPEDQRWKGMRVHCTCPSYDYHAIATKESGGKTLFVCKHLKSALDSVCGHKSTNIHNIRDEVRDDNSVEVTQYTNATDNASLRTDLASLRFQYTNATDNASLRTDHFQNYCSGMQLLQHGLGELEELGEYSEDECVYGYHASSYEDDDDDDDEEEEDKEGEDQETARLQYGLSNLSDTEIVQLLFKRMETEDGVKALAKLFPSSILPPPPSSWHRPNCNYNEKTKKKINNNLRMIQNTCTVDVPTLNVPNLSKYAVVPTLNSELPSSFLRSAMGLTKAQQKKERGVPKLKA